MEKQPAKNWDKINSSNPEERQKIEKQLQDLQDSLPEVPTDYEQEPNSVEREVIQHVLTDVEEVVRAYGGKPKPIGLDNIKIVSEEYFTEHQEQPDTVAIYNAWRNRIIIARSDSKLKFAHYLFHELMHLHSFRSLRPNPDQSSTLPRLHRTGITVHENTDRQGSEVDSRLFFDQIQEALVSILSQRYTQEVLVSHQLYAEETQATVKIKQWFRDYMKEKEKTGQKVDRDKFNTELDDVYAFHSYQKIVDIIDSLIDDKQIATGSVLSQYAYKLGQIMVATGHKDHQEIDWGKITIDYEYADYRLKFNNLITEILETAKNKSRLETREDIFSIFATAHFTGNLMPLARLLEETLGPGSFRRVAEQFQRTED